MALTQTKFLLSGRDRQRLEELAKYLEMPMSDVIRGLIRREHQRVLKTGDKNNGSRKESSTSR